MDWITHPLTYYILLSAGLSLSLFLFVSVKKENADLRKQLSEERRQINETMDSFRASMSRLELALEDTPEALPVPVFPPPSPVSMNINKRGQALRMHRRGESLEQIASALQMPRSEVELLLKVHRVVLGQG